MSIEGIVAEIDSEIGRLQQAKALLSDAPAPKKGPGRPRLDALAAAIPPVKRKRRTISAAGRKKIATAQKARWAKAKTAKGKAAADKSEGSK